MTLEFQNLNVKTSTTPAVDLLQGISLRLAPGQITALVGESGSGKSTLALTPMRLLPTGLNLTDGVVLYGDAQHQKNVLNFSEIELQNWRGREVAMVFQDPLLSLNPVMTVGDQVAEALRAHEKLPETALRERVRLIFEDVGIPDAELRMQEYPFQLSGGLRQRVLMAMALVCRPKVLIADEPTTALDATTQLQVLDLLRTLCRKHQLTILLVTHDLALVKHYADFVYVLEKGRLVESAPTNHVFENPQHPYTRRLLEALPESWRFVRPKVMDAATKSLCELQAVSKSYPLPAASLWRPPASLPVLQNVDFKIREGEILGIVGESGSGKSTLGRLLVGLENFDTGKFFFDGVDLSRASPGQIRLYGPRRQMIFQDPAASLPPHATVAQILEEPLRVHFQWPKTQIQSRVLDILNQVGLGSEFLQRSRTQLSGGQAQRVAIARALLMRPKLLVADEATSALDVTIQKQILEILFKLSVEQGLTVVLISHNAEVVRRFCDRVAVLYLGHIVEILPAAKMHQARHPYTQNLMASARFEASKNQGLFGEAPTLQNLPSGCVLQNRCPLFEDVCELKKPLLLPLRDSEHLCACHVVANQAS